MPTEAREGIYTSNLPATGRRTEFGSQASQAFVDALGSSLIVVEVRGKTEAETTLWVYGIPSWGDLGSTTAFRVAPEIYTCLSGREGAVTGSVLGFDMGHMWSGCAWSPRRTWSRRTQTDDGGISLRDRVRSILAESAENYVSLLFPSPPEKVEQPATEPHQEAVDWIKEATDLSWDRIGRLVGVSRPTLNAWRRGGPIRSDHRQRLFAVRDVLERATKRNPRPSELAAWLDTPRGSDARTPADLLEADEVDKARLLAITSRSPRVKVAPEWVARHMPEAYWNSRERVEAYPPELDEELLDPLEDED